MKYNKSNEYLNICTPFYNEINKNKSLSIKEYNNIIPLLHPNNKINNQISFSVSQNNKLNYNYPLIPIKRVSTLKDVNTSPYNNTKQNNDNSNYSNKNFTKLNNIYSYKQNAKQNQIIFNKDINNYTKNNANIIKYINHRNLNRIKENNTSNNQILNTNREHKKFNDNPEERYEKVLRLKYYKNLDDVLLINNLKYTESSFKNFIKNKSEFETLLCNDKKLLLPKMQLKCIKPNPKNTKKSNSIYEISSEKNNEIISFKTQKNVNKIKTPKITFNNKRNLIKNLKKIKIAKNELKLSIEAISIPGTNLNMNKLNQDTYFILPDIKSTNILKNNNFIQIFGIFDGHGDYGDIISKEIKDYFISYFNKLTLDLVEENNIYEKLSKNNYKEIFSLFNEIDIKLHNKYKDQDNKNICNNSGTTAHIVILFKNKILSINLGHSKSIIIYKDNNIIQLNKCHIPELEEEKKRIEENGGEVKRDEWTNEGPKRICYKKEDSKKYSGLAISRSFGDFNSEQLGVISIPEIKEYNINYNDIKIIIIATDGIWEFMSNEKIRDIILPYYDEHNMNGGINKLINFAKKIWSIRNPNYIDDLSAILVFVNN